MKGTKNTAASIDGRRVKVREGETILDASRRAGIFIPTLCHLDRLEPYGGCRMCVVEVQGMKGYPTACTTPVMPGMEILTRTTELQKLRKKILEFTLSEHPFTCLVCKDKKECADFMYSTRKAGTTTGCNFCASNGDCELQDLVEYLELDDIKFPITYRGIPPVKDNPFYDLDYNLCILCGRCVRICGEERNSNVLAFVRRGNSTIVGTAFDETPGEAGCEFCGACVDVCPTGSLSEKIGKWRGVPDRSVRTTCMLCSVACDMNVNSKNGKITQIGPKPGQRTGPFQLCLRGKFLSADINQHPSRITVPQIRRNGRWVQTSWKEAFQFCAENLMKNAGGKFGMITSGQDTIEDNYILQKFTRKVMRSNNVDMHAAYRKDIVPQLIRQFWNKYPLAGLQDIEDADTLFIIGMDASISHPLLENRIRKAYRDGKCIIYASPISTRTSVFTTCEMHYQPGKETEFLQDILRSLKESPTSGEPEKIGRSAAPELKRAANLITDSKKVLVIASDDLLRISSAGKIIETLLELNDLLSRKRKSKIMWPSYEGNLYSGTLAGVHPGLLPGFHSVTDKKSVEKWNRIWNTSLDPAFGLSGNEMIQHIGNDGITAMIVVGDIPADKCFADLEFLVQINTHMTRLSQYAQLLLPVNDFLENNGHVLSIDGRLKRLNTAVRRPGMVKSIAGIISGFASSMHEEGFPGQAADIYREITSSMEITGKTVKSGKSISGKAAYADPSISHTGAGSDDGTDSYPVTLLIRHNHFRYRGNLMSELVPDLISAIGESMIGLSPSLMKKLNAKEGEHVRVTSPTGIVESEIRSIPELKGETALLCSNGDEPDRLYTGKSPESLQMNVKIGKIQRTNQGYANC